MLYQRQRHVLPRAKLSNARRLRGCCLALSPRAAHSTARRLPPLLFPPGWAVLRRAASGSGAYTVRQQCLVRLFARGSMFLSYVSCRLRCCVNTHLSEPSSTLLEVVGVLHGPSSGLGRLPLYYAACGKLGCAMAGGLRMACGETRARRHQG